MDTISGVYSIKNNITNLEYIGSSKNIEKRWKEHLWMLESRKHHSKKLQNAWNKHGKDNFTFSIIEECELELLLETEQFWIDKKQAYKRKFGYNICEKANSVIGKKHSEETIKKIRRAKLGDLNPNWNGKSCYSETREKKRQQNLGEKNPFYGKKHSEKTREKISFSHKGEKNYLYGKKLKESHRKKMTKSVRESRSKLNWKLVCEIREKYETGEYTFVKLAIEYGVGESTINRIIKFQSWREEC